jgi:sugar lactone lactonase YvrE
LGKFTWQSVTTSVATVDNTVSGLLPNQVQAKAATPGITSIFAGNGGVSSLPVDFITCAVQSIALEITGTSGNSFTVAKGGTKTITATVVDSQNTIITGVPLTWTSSDPASVTVSATGVVSTPQPGGAAIIASCTPPTCNIGFQRLLGHSLPIYPTNAIAAIVTGASVSTTVWVSSTKCGETDGCVTTIVPITTPSNTVGAAGNLPTTPNSLLFNRQGTTAYLGTDLSLQATKGLTELTPAAAGGGTVSMFTSVIGSVLAVSPDGKKVIVSHLQTKPSEPPDQVFVFDTTSKSSVAFPIGGATAANLAADFSPDSLKAYILAGSNLYVYSTVDALQTIPLGATGTGVSFLSNGAFAYVADTSSSRVTVRSTCDNQIVPGSSPVPAPSGILHFLKTVPDGTRVLAVDSPGIDMINAVTTPVGCPPTVSNSVQTFNLSQGSFVAKQLIISQDGAKAYILASNLNNIMVFNIADQTSSSIALTHCTVQTGDPKDTCTTDNATPIQAALTPDGSLLYVVAEDGAVHVLNTLTSIDIQQIAFPVDLTALRGGLCTEVNFMCKPDLIAVKP